MGAGFMEIEIMKSGLEFLFSQTKSWQDNGSELEVELKSWAEEAQKDFTSATPSDMFEAGFCFAAGGQWDDGFGAWCSTEEIPLAPSTYSPADRKCWGYCLAVASLNNFQIDYSFVGGDNIWIVRLWKDVGEIDGTRFKGEDLGETIIAAIEKSFDLGYYDLPVPPEKEKKVLAYGDQDDFSAQENEVIRDLAIHGDLSEEDLNGLICELRNRKSSYAGSSPAI